MKRAVAILSVVGAVVLCATGVRAELTEDSVYAAYKKPSKSWTPLGVYSFITYPYIRQAVYGLDVGVSVSKRDRVAGVQVAPIGTFIYEDLWGVQLGGVLTSAENFYGLQASSLFTLTKNSNGLSLSGMSVQISGEQNGLLIAGGANSVEHSGAGLQFAGCWNSTWRDFTGLQVAGISNLIERNGSGVQLAILGNLVNGDFNGVQIAAMGNTVHGTFNGLQIGLGNEAAKGTFVQIGLINFGIERKDGRDKSSFCPILRVHY